mmetsp:Transcript_114763/g.244924  ORF Transcript_114763/g.244924 Transcript_114763/m.244924 type:complete len:219 (-) Transcript_114763:559-1215(-)
MRSPPSLGRRQRLAIIILSSINRRCPGGQWLSERLAIDADATHVSLKGELGHPLGCTCTQAQRPASVGLVRCGGARQSRLVANQLAIHEEPHSPGSMAVRARQSLPLALTSCGTLHLKPLLAFWKTDPERPHALGGNEKGIAARRGAIAGCQRRSVTGTFPARKRPEVYRETACRTVLLHIRHVGDCCCSAVKGQQFITHKKRLRRVRLVFLSHIGWL